jgi:hypothetical protein
MTPRAERNAMRQMHISQDQLDYVGLLTVPMFHLFTGTASVASGLYYAFLGLHSGTESISVDRDQAHLSQMSCAVTLGHQGTWRLSLERIDWTLPYASAWELNSAVLARGDAWLRTGVRGALLHSHYFTYTAHLIPQEGTAQEALTALKTPTLHNFGESYGTGAVFHVYFSPLQWTVQITVDHSQQVAGAVFFQMVVAINQDTLNYADIGLELYTLLRRALAATGWDVAMTVG